jgi:hypothetical protein
VTVSTGNAKGGSITVRLISCLTGLVSASYSLFTFAKMPKEAKASNDAVAFTGIFVNLITY